MRTIFLVVLAFVLLFSIKDAEAIILSGGLVAGSAQTNGGTFIDISGFNGSVGNNTFQDNNLYAFNEDQNIRLTSSLDADLGLLTIPSGTVVASHYVFFDPGPNRRAIGHVIFDAPILSVITGTGNLAASDFLINNSVTYLNPSLRGLESNDVVRIGPLNRARLNIDWRADTPGDYVRVLTERSPNAPNPVPEPATVLLMSGGLAAGAWMRRKRA